MQSIPFYFSYLYSFTLYVTPESLFLVLASVQFAIVVQIFYMNLTSSRFLLVFLIFKLEYKLSMIHSTLNYLFLCYTFSCGGCWSFDADGSCKLGRFNCWDSWLCNCSSLVGKDREFVTSWKVTILFYWLVKNNAIVWLVYLHFQFLQDHT